MRGKYITTQMRITCYSKPAGIKKNIHSQLEATIAERKRIMLQMDNLSKSAWVIDMYLNGSKAA